MWATMNTPNSLGFFMRNDIPTQFAIAEAFTVADMYAESVIASTNPNRGEVCSFLSFVALFTLVSFLGKWLN